MDCGKLPVKTDVTLSWNNTDVKTRVLKLQMFLLASKEEK